MRGRGGRGLLRQRLARGVGQRQGVFELLAGDGGALKAAELLGDGVKVDLQEGAQAGARGHSGQRTRGERGRCGRRGREGARADGVLREGETALGGDEGGDGAVGGREGGGRR
ncbi:hypothetical protein FGB62_63g013 [Gracilaria domingensis]|nr:hypothetical protein FGB62_63g013 [Gracilaria domingensis]